MPNSHIQNRPAAPLEEPAGRTLGALAVALAVTLTVTACSTVGPNYKVPSQAIIERPAAAAPFTLAAEKPFSGAQLPTYWWRLYDDPTLDKLIDKAFAANTDLRIAAANLTRVAAVLDEAHTAAEPTVAVSAAPGYGRTSAASLAQKSALPDGVRHDVAAGVSYQVDLFGKIARAVEAAGADKQAAQAAYDLTRVVVAANVARAYVQTCSANEQLQVASHSIALQQQFLQLTTQLNKSGRATDLDLSRGRSQLERLRAALPPLQAQQRGALYRLAVLTGEVPGALINSIGQCKKAPQLSQPVPIGDGAALLRRRPDIRQAERELAASSARIGVATAELYPSISLGLSAGSTGPGLPLTDTNAFHWGVGPLISWTLPNTGSAHSRIAQAEAGNQAALARFDASVLNALRETENALLVYARELDRNALLKAAREQSALAAQQARKLYRYGRTDFLTTLDADRVLAADETVLAASTAALSEDQVSLFLALGGGWEQPAGAPVAEKK